MPKLKDSLDSDYEFTIYRKDKIRNKLRRDVEEFLRKGGKVEMLPYGARSLEDLEKIVKASYNRKFGNSIN